MFNFKTLLTSAVIGFAALLPALPAHADLLLEPYLGYHLGTNKMTGFQNVNVNGVTLGGRVGYQNMGFMLGFDYMTGAWNGDSTSSTPSQTITPTDMGIFVGYNLPVMLRVYGEYDFSAKEATSANSVTNNFTGNAIKVGVGFTSLPFVSINLEYIVSTFNKENGNSLTNNMTSDMFGLTVSLPLTL